MKKALAGFMLLVGCGGAPYAELETVRAASCQAAEATIEAAADCGPGRPRDCGAGDWARIDCIRAVCDEIHEELMRRAQ